MAAPIAITQAALELGSPVRLFPTRIVFGGRGRATVVAYDVAAMGRFLINMESDARAGSIESRRDATRGFSRAADCGRAQPAWHEGSAVDIGVTVSHPLSQRAPL
jgi:hypothetical protein